jgi:hypothetical protein
MCIVSDVDHLHENPTTQGVTTSYVKTVNVLSDIGYEVVVARLVVASNLS